MGGTSDEDARGARILEYRIEHIIRNTYYLINGVL